jgi:hypothetical protein
MKPTKTITAMGIAAMSAGLSMPSHADAFYEALSGGKAKMDIRTRYETVDQDGIDDKAKGLTVRTRLGYETGELLATKAYVEMEDVRVAFGVDDYAPETAGYPIIADPRSTELNQAYLSIKPLEGLEIKPGRQRLILDNARFVGNVGWRQNEQTFDALTVNYGIAGFGLTASYITQVNGIVPHFDASDAEDTLLNLSYNFDGIGKLSVYNYAIDQTGATPNPATGNPIDLDMDTSGVRFAGKTGKDMTFHYTAEFATQDNNLNDKSADYLFGEFGIGFKPVTLFVGYELLGSDEGTYGFQTPLATKHAFNGWADKFLVTPNAGLQDSYIKAVAKAWGIKFVAVYHQYTADDASQVADKDDALGSEVNLLAVKAFDKKYKVGLKYAAYSAEDNDLSASLTDTDKLWLWGEMKF